MSPILAMIAQAVKPAVKRAAASAAASAAPARKLGLSDVRYTKAGGIARGFRKLYNDLMNEKYGKPIGKHGMTWSQLADKGYGGGAPDYAGADDEGDDTEE